MKALQQANLSTNDYSRQLILDNIALKSQAMDRYGGQLTGNNTFDLGQQNSELYGRTSLPFQIASGIQAQGAADSDRYFGGRMLDTAEGARQDAANAAAPGAAGSGRNAVNAETGVTLTKLDKNLSDLGADIGSQISAGGAKNFGDINNKIDTAAKTMREKISSTYPDEPTTEKERLFKEAWREWLWNAGVTDSRGIARGGAMGTLNPLDSYSYQEPQ